MTTYYVSGHLDLTKEEFEEHYVPQLEKAASESHSTFVVGDARGADYLAQIWFTANLAKLHDRVEVYHMFEKPRNNVGFKERGGFGSDKERDEAMTAASDEDIAWVRPGREKSGTAKNLERRSKM